MDSFLKRKALSNRSAAQTCRTLCVITAGFVMIAGIRQLPRMELTEAQVYFGSMGVMAFAGIFLILAALAPLFFSQSLGKSSIERTR